MAHVALVTGASGGIGSAIARQLHNRNIEVIGSTHTPNGLNILRQNQNIADSYLLKLDDISLINSVFDEITEKHGTINYLIHNAALLVMADFFEITPELWDDTFNVNLRGAFFLTQCFATYLRKHNSPGAIVNVASLAGKIGFTDQIPYSASKAGILSLTRTMSRELSAYNIRVHAVCPGAIDTNMFKMCLRWSAERYETTEDVLLASWLSNTVNKRLISATEVAKLIEFLTLDASMSLSGCCWDFDSGVA